MHGVRQLPRHPAAAHRPHDGHLALPEVDDLGLQERQAAGPGPGGGREDPVHIPLPPNTHTCLPASSLKKQPDSPAGSTASEEKKEPDKEKAPAGDVDKKIKEESKDAAEKFEPTALYQYLREEDLDDSPKGGVDILKSLENTMSTAISKAQNGVPSWGGYHSIHASYQLPGTMKPLPTVDRAQAQPPYEGPAKPLPSAEHSALLHSWGSLMSPPHQSNVSTMEDLVEKVTGKVSVKREERPAEKEKGSPSKAASPLAKENKDFPKSEESGGKPPRKGPDAEAGKAKRRARWRHTPQTARSLSKPTSPTAVTTWGSSQTTRRNRPSSTLWALCSPS